MGSSATDAVECLLEMLRMLSFGFQGVIESADGGLFIVGPGGCQELRIYRGAFRGLSLDGAAEIVGGGSLGDFVELERGDSPAHFQNGAFDGLAVDLLGCGGCPEEFRGLFEILGFGFSGVFLIAVRGVGLFLIGGVQVFQGGSGSSGSKRGNGGHGDEGDADLVFHDERNLTFPH